MGPVNACLAILKKYQFIIIASAVGIDGSREMRRSNQKNAEKDRSKKTRVKEIQYTVDGDGNSGRENYKPPPSADASTMNERTLGTP